MYLFYKHGEYRNSIFNIINLKKHIEISHLSLNIHGFSKPWSFLNFSPTKLQNIKNSDTNYVVEIAMHGNQNKTSLKDIYSKA